MSFIPECRPTTIGSLPHLNHQEACELVLRFTPEIPSWPQLPRVSQLENMYVQFSHYLPGVVFEDGRVFVKDGPEFDSALERLYADYLSGDDSKYLPGPDRAPGIPALVDLAQGNDGANLVAIKGQITGPISLGLQLTDSRMKPILYDDVASDALGRYLRLVASAQEKAIGKIAPRTIIFLDEPYLHALGSALFALSRDTVVRQLEEVLAGIRGLKGIHCCGNTDWGVVLSTSIDVLSFDALNYGETLALYPSDVNAFVNRGGIIAWGIVPDRWETLQERSISTLTDSLLEIMNRLNGKGIPFDRLVAQSLVTPTCGLSGLTEDGAERALELLAGVSQEMRKRYFGRNQ